MIGLCGGNFSLRGTLFTQPSLIMLPQLCICNKRCDKMSLRISSGPFFPDSSTFWERRAPPVSRWFLATSLSLCLSHSLLPRRKYSRRWRRRRASNSHSVRREERDAPQKRGRPLPPFSSSIDVVERFDKFALKRREEWRLGVEAYRQFCSSPSFWTLLVKRFDIHR